MRPKRATVLATNRCTAWLSRTSTGSKTAPPPISCATLVPPSRLMSATTTVAPAAAKATAPARPIPEAPPVMMATLPARSGMEIARAGFEARPCCYRLGRLELLICGLPVGVAGVLAVRLQRRHREELRLLLELAQVVVGIERLRRRLQLLDRLRNDDGLEGLLAEGHLPVHIQSLVGALVRRFAVRRALGDAIAVKPGEGALLRIGELDGLAGVRCELLEELAAAEGDDDFAARQRIR